MHIVVDGRERRLVLIEIAKFSADSPGDPPTIYRFVRSRINSSQGHRRPFQNRRSRRYRYLPSLNGASNRLQFGEPATALRRTKSVACQLKRPPSNRPITPPELRLCRPTRAITSLSLSVVSAKAVDMPIVSLRGVETMLFGHREFILRFGRIVFEHSEQVIIGQQHILVNAMRIRISVWIGCRRNILQCRGAIVENKETRNATRLSPAHFVIACEFMLFLLNRPNFCLSN